MNIQFMTILNRFLVIIAWLLGANFMQAEAQELQLLDKIIATVNEQILLQSELDQSYQYYQAQRRDTSNDSVLDIKYKIFESLLMNKILLAKAKIEGKTASLEEIDRAFKHRMQYFINQAGSEELLKNYIEQPLQNFQEELRKSIKEELTIEKMRNKIVGEIRVSPAEVRTYFENLPEQELPYYDTQVEVCQIVRFPKPSEQDKAAILEKLQTWKHCIQAGEPFEKFARQYSQDAGSASNGGELGFWRIGELTPAYEAAVLASKPGDIIGPIATPLGFHLIQLLNLQEDRYNSRHILLKPVVSKAAIEAEIAYLNTIRTNILEKKLSFEKAAIVYSEDKHTAQQGGALTAYGSQDIKITLAALPSDIGLIVDRLQPGEISRVELYNTSLGEQAMRIVYLKRKIPAHRANLQEDYNTIYQMALNKKKELALNEWFRNTKDEMTLRIDPAYEKYNFFK
jgi:peptidyl-prolyl cis-trans isomerase SurA